MSWLLPPLPPTFNAALRDVDARDPHARVAAARRLAEPDPGRESEAEAGLTRLTRDPLADVRVAALEALAGPGAQRRIELFAEHLDDPHPTVRELALLSLSTLEGEEATEHVRRALRSPHPELRFQAVLSYVERLGDAAEREVSAALHDDDAKVRAHAARAVGVGHLRGLSRPLAVMLAEDHGEPRYEAALSLVALGDPGGASVLCETLTDPARTLESLEALGGLAPGEHVEPIAELAGSLLRPPWMKVAAARALLRIGDPRGVEALRECLRGLRRSARSYAVEVVAEQDVIALAEDVAKLARRPRGASRERIAETLAHLAPRSGAAREALAVLSRRRDDAGRLARAALGAEPPIEHEAP